MSSGPGAPDPGDDGSAAAVATLFADPRVAQLTALGSSLWYRAEFASGRVAWTSSLLERWGYQPDETAQHVSWWLDRAHPDDLPRLTAFLAQAPTGTQEQWDVRYRFRTADGDWVRLAGQAMLVRDATGMPVASQGAVVDVT